MHPRNPKWGLLSLTDDTSIGFVPRKCSRAPCEKRISCSEQNRHETRAPPPSKSWHSIPVPARFTPLHSVVHARTIVPPPRKSIDFFLLAPFLLRNRSDRFTLESSFSIDPWRLRVQISGRSCRSFPPSPLHRAMVLSWFRTTEPTSLKPFRFFDSRFGFFASSSTTLSLTGLPVHPSSAGTRCLFGPPSCFCFCCCCCCCG